MSTMKRDRGRPAGTGKDDSKVLQAVTDLLVANPTQRPTTAMRHVAPKASDADTRRFQAKWQRGRQGLLQAACERVETRNAERRQPTVQQTASSAVSAFAAHSKDFERMARAANELAEGPTMRAIRAMEDSPMMRAIWDFENSPTMKIIRDFENSPTMTAVRLMQDSPTMRLIRHQQELTGRLTRGVDGAAPD